MHSIFEFFAKRHLLANLFTIMVLLLGINTLLTLKKDIFPNVDLGWIWVSTSYPGASSEDVELNVTNKIEDRIKNIPGIKKLTSISSENISSIRIELEDNLEDIDKTKDDIHEAVGQVTGFPAEVTDRPVITEIKGSILVPVMEIGVSGEVEYALMRETARLLEKKLKDIPGVSQISRFGWRDREVKVEIIADKLDQYQLPIQEIIHAIQKENIRSTGGTLESYTSEKNVVTLSQFKNPLDVGEVIVRSTIDGGEIRVKDLALIKDSFEEEKLISHSLGQKAISFLIFKSDEADIIRTNRKIKKMLEREKLNLPDGLSINVTNDVSKDVENSFGIVVSNGLIGLVLVLIFLTFFLNLRTAFWVAIGIPVVLLGVIFLLPQAGSSLDTLSLGAMILILGIVIDDSIIISESIHSRYEQGDDPLTAAVRGTMVVIVPVITTMLSTLVVFLPMFFMPGIMGKFIFVYPLVVCFALLISLFEVIIALPAHIIPGLQLKREKNITLDIREKIFKKVKFSYKVFARRLFKFRYMNVLVFIIILIGSLSFAAKYMDFILFPTSGAKEFWVSVELPSGSSLQATEDTVNKLEEIINKIPRSELDSYYSRTGILTGQAMEKFGENFASIAVYLTPISNRSREAGMIVDELRKKFKQVEGKHKTSIFIASGGPPVGKPVEIRIVGSNDDMRLQLANDVTSYLKKMNGVKDIHRDDKLGKQQIEITLNKSKLALLGLTVADVATNVRIAYDGQVATSVRYGEEDVDFRVMLTQDTRRSVEFLKIMKVANRNGGLIQLNEVAEFIEGEGPSDINHFHGERVITITSDLDQKINTPLKVTQAILDKFNTDREYKGVRIIIGGAAQESAESYVSLFIMFGIAALGICFLLMLLFDSIFQPILVIVAVPFGIIGVIIAFALHGEPLGFMVLLGVVGLSGVVVNDSLVMVAHINSIRKNNPEMDITEVVATGAADRIRAILMTTLTTVAGLLPLAYGLGGTDTFSGPMAMAVGWGLIFATPLTLILVPSLYLIGTDMEKGVALLKRSIFNRPQKV